MMSFIILNVVMLSVIMLITIMLNAVMLSAVMPSVMASDMFTIFSICSQNTYLYLSNTQNLDFYEDGHFLA